MSSISNLYDLMRGKKTLNNVLSDLKPKKEKKRKNKKQGIKKSDQIYIDDSSTQNKKNMKNDKKLKYPEFESAYDKYRFQSYMGSQINFHEPEKIEEKV